MSAMVRAEDLSDELGGVLPLRPVLLDVQYQLGGPPSPELYASGHLPGARHLPLEGALAGEPGADGRHPLPEPAALEAALRVAGLDDDAQVVVYDQGSGLGSARAWWVLRWAGIDDVRVLDGGLAAWRGAGLAVTTDEVPAPPGTVQVRPGSLPVLDADGAARVAAEGVLVDARTPERFRGEQEPIDPVAGHVPGAVNVPMGDLLDGGLLRTPEELRARFAEVGVAAPDETQPDETAPDKTAPDKTQPGTSGGTPPAVVGAYCGSGITAAHTVLALHEAGIEATPYIGSWSGWITDPARPVATGD